MPGDAVGRLKKSAFARKQSLIFNQLFSLGVLENLFKFQKTIQENVSFLF